MLLRPATCRLSTPTSWFSRFSATTTTMPLRAKVTNPAFGAVSKMSTAPSIPKELPGDEPDDVLFNSLYGVRSIELNRPKKLNALNASMVRKILPRLEEWKKSQLANVIIVSGAGPKALCAGGDVAALAKSNQKGAEGQQASTDFFGLEYTLDHLIASYPKPYISIMDGVTMGGGVGLSVHAPFRIATERTLFAMPETAIGFFPEVGGSFFLPRLDGQLGTYLALTSERLHGAQALYAGIATHYIDSSVLSNLTARLSELVFKDTAPLTDRLNLVNSTIAEFSTGLPADQPVWPAGNLRRAIDRCFKYNTVEEIFQALERESSPDSPPDHQKEWARNTLDTLSARSPTSLKVALRQMRLGRDWSIAEAFQREYHISSRFMRHPDFVEGVSARLLTKPPRAANWQPASLEDVSAEAVNDFFVLPQSEERLALLGDADYKQYPHAQFALPSERDIEAFVRGNADNAEQTQLKFVEKWGNKEGVREKVAEVLARRTVRTDEGLRWVDE